MIFVDTPGIHKPSASLGQRMNREATAAIADADVVLMVVDATETNDTLSRDAYVFSAVQKSHKPVVLVVNKVDQIKPRSDLLPKLLAFDSLHPWLGVVPVSAKKNNGIDRIVALCEPHLPEGPALFPADALTDRPERFLVAERVREAVIYETTDEVPYVTAVAIERFEEGEKSVHIQATIHVERQGQKKIVIGASGEKIRAIGLRARTAIQKILGRKIVLELWVKVSPDWTRNDSAMRELGYGATGPARRS